MQAYILVSLVPRNHSRSFCNVQRTDPQRDRAYFRLKWSKDHRVSTPPCPDQSLCKGFKPTSTVTYRILLINKCRLLVQRLIDFRSQLQWNCNRMLEPTFQLPIVSTASVFLLMEVTNDSLFCFLNWMDSWLHWVIAYLYASFRFWGEQNCERYYLDGFYCLLAVIWRVFLFFERLKMCRTVWLNNFFFEYQIFVVK